MELFNPLGVIITLLHVSICRCYEELVKGKQNDEKASGIGN